MKNSCWVSLTQINAIISTLVVASLLVGCNLLPGRGKTNGGSSGDKSGTGWKVWVKTSPCSGGRTDWISVAKENPGFGGGGSSWQTADLLTSPLTCTVENSCTFATAQDTAAKVRPSNSFSKYCCRDYSVWKNTQTNEFTIVKGQGTAGFGWQFEKGNLCCEEAENIAGKSGACSGSTQGSNIANPENIGCAKEYRVYEDTRNGKRYVARGRFTTPEMRLIKDNLCCEEAGKLAGVPVTCNGKTSGND